MSSNGSGNGGTLRDSRDASRPLSGKLASMRFMLRAKDAEEARKTEEKKIMPAPPSESASSSAAASAALIRGTGRLVAVADDFTTADRGLATAVTDTGFCVAGRRSWLGANKGVEKFARAAYADACNAPDLSDAAMAATLTSGKTAGKRSRASGGGAPRGSRDFNSQQKGLMIIDDRSSSGKPRNADDDDSSAAEEDAVRAAVAQTAVRRPVDDNDADESEFAALPFVRPKKS